MDQEGDDEHGPSAPARGSKALADAVRKIAAKFLRVHRNRNDEVDRNGKKIDALWADEPDGRFGVRTRIDLLLRCWVYLDPLKTKEVVAHALYESLAGSLPWRTRPDQAHVENASLETGRWVVTTLWNYLQHKDNKTTAEEAEQIYEGILALMADSLSSRQGSDLGQLKSLARYEYEATVHDAINCLLEAGGLKEGALWYSPVPFEPMITGGLAHAANPNESTKLKEKAEEALRELRRLGQLLAVVLSGAARSGRKTVLRLLLGSCPGGWLTLEDGATRIPILAASMEDHTPDEFIDLVYEFYKAADRRHTPSEEPGTTELHAWVKIGRIADLALRTPACFLFAGVEPIDDDEIVRSLKGSRIDVVILAILRGHPLGRVVFTVRRQFDQALVRKLKEHCSRVSLLKVPTLTEARDRQGLSTYLQTALPIGFRASGVSWVLADALLKLAVARGGARGDILRLQKKTEVALNRDRAASFAKIIFKDVLTPGERTLLGLIASSHDGLRLSLLVRMVGSLDRGVSRVASGSCPAGFERTLEALRALVSRREARADVVLASNGEPQVEPRYWVEDAWRNEFQAEWRRTDPEKGRFGMWLIAREATHQARWIRISDAGRKSPRLHGRDVQALYALIGSVDVDGVPGSMEQPIPRQHLESVVLPPLGQEVQPPHPVAALRFAMLQLYRKDLEGKEYRLLTVLEDARCRLGVLLAFFEPDAPWRGVDERMLETTWESYQHLRTAFRAGELMTTITGIALAALRLQRFDLVSSAVRLGEALMLDEDAAMISRIELMRLLRSEIDAGMLLGGNPDAFPTPRRRRCGAGVQLGDVIIRAEVVLDLWFGAPGGDESDVAAQQRLVARGKLHARIAEACHLAGRRKEARAAFDAALSAEGRFLEALPQAEQTNPVLGGRGLRSLLQFEIDAAQHQAAEGGRRWVMFEDGLVAPEPPALPTGDEAMLRARRCLDENARRLVKGRVNEAIGIRVDAALLDAAGHDFRGALRHLDAAMEMPRGSDPSLEALLELTAVGARVAIDAAIVCLRWADAKATFPTPGAPGTRDVLDRLRGNFGSKDAAAPDIARLLLDRASRSLGSLQRLCESIPYPIHPYAMLATYLSGLSHVVLSRLDGKGRRGLMQTAMGELEGACAQMRSSQCERHLAEADAVLDSLRRALDQSAPDAAERRP